jgi:aspartate aminotransferase
MTPELQVMRRRTRTPRAIEIDEAVESISMPENVRVGLHVAEQRKTCSLMGCNAEIYAFGFGQSPFPVPAPLRDALGRAADRGHYSAAEGIEPLREAVAAFNRRHFDLDVDPSRIVVGHGTKGLMYTLFGMIRGSAIIPAPGWIGYAPQLRLLGKHYHLFPLKPEDHYKVHAADLDAFIAGLPTEQHLLILNNPHNPTGAVYSSGELEAIAEVCRDHGTLVLADEIYALLTYEIETFTSMAAIYPEGTFVTNGLSKDRSSGGYRLGTCILPEHCPEKLHDDFTKIAATVYTNVSTPTQHAAITAYEPDEEIEDDIRTCRAIHRIMGAHLSRMASEIDGVTATTPKGGFYFLADFNALAGDLQRAGVASSDDLAHSLIAHPHHISTITGEAIMADADNYAARIAFVDYDGKRAMDLYRQAPPASAAAEWEFMEAAAPRMVAGMEELSRWVGEIAGR